MPKPLIKQQKSQRMMNVQKQHISDKQMDSLLQDRILRKKRSKAYLEAMKKLDAGGHVHNQKEVDDLIGVIVSEFPEIQIQDILLGIISKCYLGIPYEVHTLDITLNIVRHYKIGECLPDGLEKARYLAKQGTYMCIEVYSDAIRAISENGNVSVIRSE